MTKPERRRTARRRSYGRRRADVWSSIGKSLGLLASITGALYGQAELVGEPWRHYLSGVCIAATAGFGFLLGPEHLRVLLGKLKGGRS